jgi:sirohydrochlorin ferrochelatase
MQTLILIAHGSRIEQSNEEVRNLTSRLRELIGARFQHVECAFLELAEPSIPAAIDTAIAGGSSRVVLLPYFLAGGSHVSLHIPDIVARKQAQYPQSELELRPHLGQAEDLVDFLAKLAKLPRSQPGKGVAFRRSSHSSS